MRINLNGCSYTLGCAMKADRGKGISFDSESFEGLEYLAKEDHPIFKGRRDGLCAIALENILSFTQKLMAIYETYRGRT